MRESYDSLLKQRDEAIRRQTELEERWAKWGELENQRLQLVTMGEAIKNDKTKAVEQYNLAKAALEQLNKRERDVADELKGIIQQQYTLRNGPTTITAPSNGKANGTHPEPREGTLQRRILNTVRATPRSTPNEINAQLPDLTPKQVRDTLCWLRKYGLIDRLQDRWFSTNQPNN